MEKNQTADPETLPGFSPLKLVHQEMITSFFRADPPQVSELSFTNLYMWRQKNRPQWKIHEGCLLLVLHPLGQDEPHGLMPVGNGDKPAALDGLMEALAKSGASPRLERADRPFVENHLDTKRFAAQPDRDNFDYVYKTESLISLGGRKLHRKKNHLNRFMKEYDYQYLPLGHGLVEQVLELQEEWCDLRECRLHEGLGHEDQAVCQALESFSDLEYLGGVILLEGKVAAFALGEMLNYLTAVIHIEKADPRVPGLYAAMNQLFAQYAWPRTEFINREQDLGVEGLRKAKKSYQPDHLVEKFIVTSL